MLNIVTIVLNGRPMIEWHLAILEQLSIPWRWIIVEGTSGNTADQAWCAKQDPGLSTDGTTEYLDSISSHSNVTVIRNAWWENKTQMMNAATSLIEKPGVLLQMDSDEVYEPDVLSRIVALFSLEVGLGSIRLPCAFLVGPELVTIGKGCYGNKKSEWHRAFRFKPGMLWKTHEPPCLLGCDGRTMGSDEAETNQLRFTHFAYVMKSQVEAKERFYKYKGLTAQWEKLQKHTHFPDHLAKFFPHVDERVMVGRLNP